MAVDAYARANRPVRRGDEGRLEAARTSGDQFGASELPLIIAHRSSAGMPSSGGRSRSRTVARSSSPPTGHSPPSMSASAATRLGIQSSRPNRDPRSPRVARDYRPRPAKAVQNSEHVACACVDGVVGGHRGVGVAMATLVECGHRSRAQAIEHRSPEEALLAQSVQEQQGRRLRIRRPVQRQGQGHIAVDDDLDKLRRLRHVVTVVRSDFALGGSVGWPDHGEHSKYAPSQRPRLAARGALDARRRCGRRDGDDAPSRRPDAR